MNSEVACSTVSNFANTVFHTFQYNFLNLKRYDGDFLLQYTTCISLVIARVITQ